MAGAQRRRGGVLPWVTAGRWRRLAGMVAALGLGLVVLERSGAGLDVAVVAPAFVACGTLAAYLLLPPPGWPARRWVVRARLAVLVLSLVWAAFALVAAAYLVVSG